MIVLFTAGLLTELSIYLLPFLWHVRKALAICSILLTAIFVGLLSARLILTARLTIFNLGIILMALYRIFNLFRILENRMHEQYLRRAVRRTSLMLLILQIVLMLLTIWWNAFSAPPVSSYTIWLIVAGLQLIVASGVLITTLRTLLKTTYPSDLIPFTDKELPSITVAIPARNETEDLSACLTTVLASDYSKLEILVLDDCSQDRTPEVIRSFAHDGVRFVQGSEPAERWLAKNQAYEKLAQEASGEFILFCGVDVRLGRQTIRALMTYALLRNKQMVSVLPKRPKGGLSVSLIQPMRYWWELALPRRLFNRPAVLSSCWLIKKQALTRMGSFSAVSHAILPESYFARNLIKQDGYSFMRSSNMLDVQTVKTLAEQRDTALRVRYPQLRRRPEGVLVVVCIELVFFVLPFGIVFSGLWMRFGTIQVLAILTALLLALTHSFIVTVTNSSSIAVAFLTFPFAALTDVVLLFVSMAYYEFSTINWKGRNVCLPVMHAVPRLPEA